MFATNIHWLKSLIYVWLTVGACLPAQIRMSLKAELTYLALYSPKY